MQVAGWLNASTLPLYISYCFENKSTTFIEYYDLVKSQGRDFRSTLGLPEKCSGPNDVTCGPFFCHMGTTYIVLEVRAWERLILGFGRVVFRTWWCTRSMEMTHT